MSTPPKSPSGRSGSPRAARAPRQEQDAKQLQPQPTGGNRGSPAAPVMKQFAKTKAETSGKP
ncbi:MAG TPA: hypothetical protein VFM98_21020 [Ramlibacter sp.]|uniref:hypothetical protein n=1 Tax=Ramlibacter sp. TaxID=1917967 RepID=UPI002D800087|nr:hypothetical protein [Ramlibacter sp.]HET8748092.1 hypothetical protein [Ramlibacter sp.]